jgi:glycosyltransferase involved in cell wall biosynthesis
VLVRLAVLTDYPDEGWPSMDLCGDMLLAHLAGAGSFPVEAHRVCPPFRRLASRLPWLGRRDVAFNADRLFNRFIHFPREARRRARHFDLFHVADHTYGQLIHELPGGRAGVYCHDLDAFRCLLEPAHEPRPRWFRAFARRILTGVQKAAVVFHNSAAVGQQLVRWGLVPSERIVHAPLGVAPEFTAEEGRSLPQHAAVRNGLDREDGPRMVHVGSCIPRKRVDVLLDVFARVRTMVPGLRLWKVGGAWTNGQREQIERLGLNGAVVHVAGISRADLADLYRRAAAVVVPSEAEGFGLPVIEALACGAPVVASDIPALREAGGPAAVYAPVGDVEAWAEAVVKVLTEPSSAPPRAERLAWAARFSWAAHAQTIARAYHGLL